MNPARLAIRCVILAVVAAGTSACDMNPFDDSCEERGELVCASGGASGPLDFHPPTQVTTSDVTVEPAAGGGFTAKQVVIITNSFDGATRGSFSVHIDAGTISSVPAPSSEYEVRIALAATAPTEAQARTALAAIDSRHEDWIGEDTVIVSHTVNRHQQDDGVEHRADIVLALPPGVPYDIVQHTSAGDVSSSGLHGGGISLGTGAGDATLAGTWDRAEVDTNEGIVAVDADVGELTAGAYTGAVNVAIPGTRAAEISVTSNDGDIDIEVGRTAATVFDLEGETFVGNVTILVGGTEPVGTQTAVQRHHRSPDYGSQSRQVHVAGSTTFGDVTIHD